MNDFKNDNLVNLQKTIYQSRNPTRRWLHTSRRDKIIEALKSFSDPLTKHAMEVGPGSGVYLPTLCQHYYQVTAADIEDAHIKNLSDMQNRYANLCLRQADIRVTKWAQPFDLLLCSEVIEHVPEPDDFIGALSRAVVPGGILILSTPQPWSLMELTCKVGLSSTMIGLTRLIYGEPVMPTGHISVLGQKRLLEMLGRHKFDVISSETFGLYLPLIAEIFGTTAVWLEDKGEQWLKAVGWNALLWTQLHIVRKRTK